MVFRNLVKSLLSDWSACPLRNKPNMPPLPELKYTPLPKKVAGYNFRTLYLAAILPIVN
jgi:hypothetical protein